MCQEAGADVLGLVSPSALCLPLSAGAVSVPRLQSPVANWGGVLLGWAETCIPPPSSLAFTSAAPAAGWP